jgi:hypothetical protein
MEPLDLKPRQGQQTRAEREFADSSTTPTTETV